MVSCKGIRANARLRLPMCWHGHSCQQSLSAGFAFSASPSTPTGHPLLHAGRALVWSPTGTLPPSTGTTGLQRQKMPWRQIHLVHPARPRQLSLQRLGYRVDGYRDKGRQRLSGGRDGPCATPYKSSQEVKICWCWRSCAGGVTPTHEFTGAAARGRPGRVRSGAG